MPIAGTTLVQPRQCAVLDKPVAPAAPFCACTTCHYDAAVKRCAGKCPLSHVCTRGAHDLVCRCVRKVPIIVVVVLGALGVAILVLVLVALGRSGSGGGRRGSMRASYDLAKGKGA